MNVCVCLPEELPDTFKNNSLYVKLSILGSKEVDVGVTPEIDQNCVCGCVCDCV